MAINDDLNRLFPSKYNYSYCRGSVVINETSPTAKIRCVEWQNSCFHTFDCTQIKDWKDLFNPDIDILYHDCDGIFTFVEDGQKYMFLNELKSSFDTTDIYDARKQIISSYLKANMIFNISQCYEKNDYIVKGFIFTLPPKGNFLRDLHKKMLFKPGSKYKDEFEFVDDLCNTPNKTLCMYPSDCYELKNLPIHNRVLFEKMEFYLIEVPDGEDSITLDVRQFI